MIQEIQAIVARMVRSMRRPATLGTVAGASGKQAQLTTENAAETVPARFMQQYGFASRPPSGSPAAAVYRGGQTSGALVIATGHSSYTVALEDGEVALYHPTGSRVHMDEDGNVILIPATGKKVLEGSAAAAHPAVLGDLQKKLDQAAADILATAVIPSGVGPLPLATDATANSAQYPGAVGTPALLVAMATDIAAVLSGKVALE